MSVNRLHIIHRPPTIVIAIIVTALISSLPLFSTTAQADGENDKTDFNGDGYTDLAIGVPQEDVGSVVDAGSVNIIYGSANGLSATSTPDQTFSQNSPGIEGTAEAGDLFGASLATGDFNNDGYSDLVIGVPNEDLDGLENAGLVHVIYGSSSGLSVSAVPPDQIWDKSQPNVDGNVVEFDFFGTSLTIGDFNNDGYDDLAIGAPSASSHGTVNVIYGSSSGLSATVMPDGTGREDQFWNEVNVFRGEYMGNSLASGDFNNDGYDDLAMGAALAQADGPEGAGAVHILYGSPEGLSTTFVPEQFWHQNILSSGDKEDLEDNFGFSLAAGDFNNDEFDDLAIGAPFEDVGTLIDAGAVNVIYGSSEGLRTSAAGDGTGRTDQFWHQNTPNVEGATEVSDQFGSSLATGDFNNDGFGDLAIGVPQEDIGTISGAGGVNVIYGSSSGLGASPSGDGTGMADQFWSQNSKNVKDWSESSDFFGQALAAGDLNNDGYDDLAVGVPLESVKGVFGAGAVNVIYGSSEGLKATAAADATGRADQFWHQDSGNIEGKIEIEDRFGSSLA